jgi:hypothetical protein
VRVLDPACGSGNFLYLAILALKDLEHKVNLDAEALGLGRQFPSIGPECVKGIEINPYAAELARVTVWIGEIQWMRRNGFDVARKPILRPLNTIECRDAIMNPDCTEPEWPEAEVIVGNPPFLGDRKMIRSLGEKYTTQLRKLYKGRVPGACNLVCYWFAKAEKTLSAAKISRFGFVATNNIRSGVSRLVLDQLVKNARIYAAWEDEPWTIDGAAVRISMICATRGQEPTFLNGVPVTYIHADLTMDKVTIANASILDSNKEISFVGVQKNGPFDITGGQSRLWLKFPLNPNGRHNSDVLHPSINGEGIVRRNPDRWLVDFGVHMSLNDASLSMQHLLST